MTKLHELLILFAIGMREITHLLLSVQYVFYCLIEVNPIEIAESQRAQ